jgi:hypothetical protein
MSESSSSALRDYINDSKRHRNMKLFETTLESMMRRAISVKETMPNRLSYMKTISAVQDSIALSQELARMEDEINKSGLEPEKRKEVIKTLRFLEENKVTGSPKYEYLKNIIWDQQIMKESMMERAKDLKTYTNEQLDKFEKSDTGKSFFEYLRKNGKQFNKTSRKIENQENVPV